MRERERERERDAPETCANNEFARSLCESGSYRESREKEVRIASSSSLASFLEIYLSVTERERERAPMAKVQKTETRNAPRVRPVFLDMGAREFMAGTTFRHAGN